MIFFVFLVRIFFFKIKIFSCNNHLLYNFKHCRWKKKSKKKHINTVLKKSDFFFLSEEIIYGNYKKKQELLKSDFYCNFSFIFFFFCRMRTYNVTENKSLKKKNLLMYSWDEINLIENISNCIIDTFNILVKKKKN